MGLFRGEAEEQADKILAKAKSKVDKEELVSRLEVSLEKKALQNGLLLFSGEEDVSIKAYRGIGATYGVGIAIDQQDDTRRCFRYSLCFCSPSDFNVGLGWKDDKALSLLGMRLLADDVYEMNFPVMVTHEVVVQAALTGVMADAFLGGEGIPNFLMRLATRGQLDQGLLCSKIR